LIRTRSPARRTLPALLPAAPAMLSDLGIGKTKFSLDKN
jgi:hypothetical protein